MQIVLSARQIPSAISLTTTTMFPQQAGMSSKVSDLLEIHPKKRRHSTHFFSLLPTNTCTVPATARSFICYRLKSDSFVKRWGPPPQARPRKTRNESLPKIPLPKATHTQTHANKLHTLQHPSKKKRKHAKDSESLAVSSSTAQRSINPEVADAANQSQSAERESHFNDFFVVVVSVSGFRNTCEEVLSWARRICVKFGGDWWLIDESMQTWLVWHFLQF